MSVASQFLILVTIVFSISVNAETNSEMSGKSNSLSASSELVHNRNQFKNKMPLIEIESKEMVAVIAEIRKAEELIQEIANDMNGDYIAYEKIIKFAKQVATQKNINPGVIEAISAAGIANKIGGVHITRKERELMCMGFSHEVDRINNLANSPQNKADVTYENKNYKVDDKDKKNNFYQTRLDCQDISDKVPLSVGIIRSLEVLPYDESCYNTAIKLSEFQSYVQKNMSYFATACPDCIAESSKGLLKTLDGTIKNVAIAVGSTAAATSMAGAFLVTPVGATTMVGASGMAGMIVLAKDGPKIHEAFVAATETLEKCKKSCSNEGNSTQEKTAEVSKKLSSPQSPPVEMRPHNKIEESRVKPEEKSSESESDKRKTDKNGYKYKEIVPTDGFYSDYNISLSENIEKSVDYKKYQLMQACKFNRNSDFDDRIVNRSSSMSLVLEKHNYQGVLKFAWTTFKSNPDNQKMFPEFMIEYKLNKELATKERVRERYLKVYRELKNAADPQLKRQSDEAKLALCFAGINWTLDTGDLKCREFAASK